MGRRGVVAGPVTDRGRGRRLQIRRRKPVVVGVVSMKRDLRVKSGDAFTADLWNELVTEVVRLGNLKVGAQLVAKDFPGGHLLALAQEIQQVVIVKITDEAD